MDLQKGFRANCSFCNGLGQVTVKRHKAGATTNEKEPCPVCKGTGKIQPIQK